jgi:hypothetical protein
MQAEMPDRIGNQDTGGVIMSKHRAMETAGNAHCDFMTVDSGARAEIQIAIAKTHAQPIRGRFQKHRWRCPGPCLKDANHRLDLGPRGRYRQITLHAPQSI